MLEDGQPPLKRVKIKTKVEQKLKRAETQIPPELESFRGRVAGHWVVDEAEERLNVKLATPRLLRHGPTADTQIKAELRE